MRADSMKHKKSKEFCETRAIFHVKNHVSFINL